MSILESIFRFENTLFEKKKILEQVSNTKYIKNRLFIMYFKIYFRIWKYSPKDPVGVGNMLKKSYMKCMYNLIILSTSFFFFLFVQYPLY